ncbi:RNA polymerase factor sigma-54 [uncultured Bartonella sp.]|uniref:RNA polymerase factor sigma-54 n=1 Tax=uncultured Bartonella sp. TaxID=104108 RepID=UPI002615E47B|nr:RNA polymerase factor sigma-54 [uncultured Bartonella sp.]
MALSPSLGLHPSQSLVMTPQLMQSIKLLQMTSIELEKFIDDALENNPLLERKTVDDTDEGKNIAASNNDVSDEMVSLNTFELSSSQDVIDRETASNMFNGGDETNFSPTKTVDAGFTKDRSSDFSNVSAKTIPLDEFDIVENIAGKMSLNDYVAEQIAFEFKTQIEHDIAVYLSYELDEAGYFTGSIAKAAEDFSVGEETVLSVLKRLQQFDPPGLFATSLCECLSLQLERQNRLDPAIKVVLDNLPLLAKRDFSALAKLSSLDENEVADILLEIRNLDPKPGMAYCRTIATPVIPDVIVSELGNGEFFVELNPAILPKLVIHRDYAIKIVNNSIENNFISRCLREANWLIRALDQREKTLVSVSAEIVRHQQEFLRRGIAFLKPLTLLMIADAVGMHESTISRVTANKYVATPRGIFEMRSFFSAALQSSEGDEHYAADAVRYRIRELIDGENVDQIVSDDMLVQLLRKENINIARRTVAKYREQLNIASSVLRRREKKLKSRTTID